MSRQSIGLHPDLIYFNNLAQERHTSRAHCHASEMSGHFQLYNNVPPGVIMEMSNITHMNSIAIMANHMSTQVYPYLMLIVLKGFRLS